MKPKFAHEVFAGNFGVPGRNVNSQSFSHTHSNKNYQVGGNRLTGAMRPQMIVPDNRKHFPTLTAKPAQHRVIAPGAISGRAGQKVPFNNANRRPLAGSAHAGVGKVLAFKTANSLSNQHMTRATARDVSGLNTTTRRGGASNLHFAKPVAGTQDTYALPSPQSSGRNNAQLIKVSSVHHIGWHKIVVMKTVAKTANRPKGKI